MQSLAEKSYFPSRVGNMFWVNILYKYTNFFCKYKFDDLVDPRVWLEADVEADCEEDAGVPVDQHQNVQHHLGTTFNNDIPLVIF